MKIFKEIGELDEIKCLTKRVFKSIYKWYVYDATYYYIIFYKWLEVSYIRHWKMIESYFRKK